MKRLRDERGFTVIEVVIAMVILLVVMGAALSVMDTGARTERAQFARRVALEDLRTAMGRMTKEIRQALIVSTASTRSRLEMTTLFNGAERSVVYEVVGDELRRTVDADVSERLTDGLTSGEIFCYDPPLCGLTSPATANPEIVRISMTAEPAQFANDATITLATDVQLRNS